MRITDTISILTALGGMMLMPLPAQAEQPPSYNRVDFEVNARQDVDNDEITVTMAIERDGQKPAILADTINKVMKDAVAQGKKYQQIRVRTGSYSIRPVYTRDQRLDHWTANQTLILNSHDSVAVTELMQKLQQDLQVKSTSFSVSRALRDKVQEHLIGQALDRFKQRADLISKGLGFKQYRIVDISVVTPGIGNPRPMRAMAMASEMAPPTLEGGWSEVVVTVTGTIEMQPTP